MSDWTRTDSFSSIYGFVWRLPTGDWGAKVNVDGRFARISETYVSAEVAMGVVERTWKREVERNGTKPLLERFKRCQYCNQYDPPVGTCHCGAR
jgi:hypothetical protein